MNKLIYVFWFVLMSEFDDLISCSDLISIPAGIYLLKDNDRNTRTRCKIRSKLTIKTPERRQWRLSGVFIVNFEHIPYLVLVFLLLTLNMYLPDWIYKSKMHKYKSVNTGPDLVKLPIYFVA